MIIIIGLGNPGEKFNNTRHNVGFEAVSKIAADFQFPDFALQSKFSAEISQGELSGQKVVLAKPQTFMNDSGKTAAKLTTHYKLPTTNLIVIHDDIDLPLGKIKIVKDRGSAGHKGVESIINQLGSSDFVRIRIGIEPADNSSEAKKIVLKKFSSKEKVVVDETIKKASSAAKCFIENGLEKAMNEYNG